MADDINHTLRSELNAALEALAPQLRGLADLAASPTISGELQGVVRQQIADRDRRQTLIKAVLAALDNAIEQMKALQADGYPDLPTVPLAQFAELKAEQADIAAAAAIFTDEAARPARHEDRKPDEPEVEERPHQRGRHRETDR